MRNRTNPNVYNVFRTLLGEDDLLVNHDRACFFRPTLVNNSWSTAANLHLDVNPWIWMGDSDECKKTLDSLSYEKASHFIYENNQSSHLDGLHLQGVLNLADNKEEDGGFQCVAGFLHHFKDYFSSPSLKPFYGRPSFSFTQRSPLFDKGTRISMRPGSLVIWDVRLPHGSLPNRSENFRAAQFLRMFPAKIVSPKRKNARKKAVQHKLEQLHWAEVNGKLPSERFELTDLAKQLLGF
eukprot:TRINITY_DN703_c0_g2_i2.p1 TRINITY_DN703_c0_g2~~TRINITY_DN703_c0_g2_i2.p1  ORF type:complete len:238 (-),score=46.71 TRINITY_DN703_c0_g2_i2:58-771(-)